MTFLFIPYCTLIKNFFSRNFFLRLKVCHTQAKVLNFSAKVLFKNPTGMDRTELEIKLECKSTKMDFESTKLDFPTKSKIQKLKYHRIGFFHKISLESCLTEITLSAMFVVSARKHFCFFICCKYDKW